MHFASCLFPRFLVVFAVGVPHLTYSLQHILCRLSRGFFEDFCSTIARLGFCFPRLLTHLLQHILCGLSRGFSNFFLRFSSPPFGFTSNLGGGVVSFPLTSLVQHISPQIASGNVAQKREFYKRFICTICLLTNCWGLCYNKISARAHVSEPPKNEMEKPHRLGGVSLRRADRQEPG